MSTCLCGPPNPAEWKKVPKKETPRSSLTGGAKIRELWLPNSARDSAAKFGQLEDKIFDGAAMFMMLRIGEIVAGSLDARLERRRIELIHV